LPVWASVWHHIRGVRLGVRCQESRRIKLGVWRITTLTFSRPVRWRQAVGGNGGNIELGIIDGRIARLLGSSRVLAIKSRRKANRTDEWHRRRSARHCGGHWDWLLARTIVLGLHRKTIALLVRTPFNTFLPFFAVGIDTFFCYTVFNAAEAGPSVIAFLAGFLAVSAGVFYLSALAASRLRGHHSGWKGIHVHRHAGIWQGMNRH